MATDFISFTRCLISEARKSGNISASDHLKNALNCLIRFRGDTPLPFRDFNTQLVESLEKHMREKNLTPNTTSYYMRKLRSVYNKAVDRGFTTHNNPFLHVYKGIARTRKRAVSLAALRRLRNLDLKKEPRMEMARDLFLFSFYTRGMSFIDMSYLRKTDIRNGILSYRRRKTGQRLTIRWENHMQKIVERYSIRESRYLLPIIKRSDRDSRRQYQTESHLINLRLHELGRRIGLTEPLTMYCARHSWASIARDNQIPISVISQGMGHDSEKTTLIYLSSIDASVIDNANRDIMSLLDT